MPRLGLGMPITAGLSQEAVTTIDDFFFESNASGEVNPMQTASRTNLIPYSEDFNNASWHKSLITFTSNYATAPDGTQTAYRLVSTGGSYPQFHDTLTGLTVGKTYTVSFHVKSDGTTQIQQSAHITSKNTIHENCHRYFTHFCSFYKLIFSGGFFLFNMGLSSRRRWFC